MQIPEVIKKLSIDLETYSSVPIKCGVYPYAESPDAEILLFGYSINDKSVIVVDVANGEEIPNYILKALTDDSVIKWAFNASFERVFLSYWLKRNYPEYFESYSILEDSVGNYLDPSSWKCSMISVTSVFHVNPQKPTVEEQEICLLTHLKNGNSSRNIIKGMLKSKCPFNINYPVFLCRIVCGMNTI